MTESDWLNTQEPWMLVSHLDCWAEADTRLSNRQWRLFACAAIRSIWGLLTDDLSRQTVDVAERFADGLLSVSELTRVAEAAEERAWPTQVGYCPYTADYVASQLAITETGSHCRSRACWVYMMVLEVIGASTPAEQMERTRMEREFYERSLLRDIFANPFRPQPLTPSVLQWNHGTIVRLAEAVYEERSMPGGTFDSARLAALADGLEEAGADSGLVEHLREPGMIHVRGCHVVDLLLGKS